MMIVTYKQVPWLVCAVQSTSPPCAMLVSRLECRFFLDMRIVRVVILLFGNVMLGDVWK